MLEHRSPFCSSTLEHNRVIFSEVSRDQIVSNYYLLVLYISGTRRVWGFLGSGTREQSLRAFEHPWQPARARKGYLLEQGSTSILEHLGSSIALEHLGGSSSSSRASTVVPMLEHGCPFARACRA